MRLEPAEKRLVESAARGELCDLLSDFETEQERTIRAAVLRDLCLQRRGWTVDPGGVRVRGAIFTEKIDLAYCDLPFELDFIECEFRSGIDLSLAKVRQLTMDGCKVDKHLEANQCLVDGSIFLRDGFEVRGSVSFGGAKVGGQFDCSGGKFLGKGEWCLFAQGIEVGQDVFLCKDFKACGSVSFAGAKVSGQFDCSGGKFLGKGEWCLFVQGIEVGQDVLLRNDFEARGSVSFGGLRWAGSLIVAAGSFWTKASSVLLQRG
jgi:hypothetical protein